MREIKLDTIKIYFWRSCNWVSTKNIRWPRHSILIQIRLHSVRITIFFKTTLINNNVSHSNFKKPKCSAYYFTPFQTTRFQAGRILVYFIDITMTYGKEKKKKIHTTFMDSESNNTRHGLILFIRLKRWTDSSNKIWSVKVICGVRQHKIIPSSLTSSQRVSSRKMKE